MKFCGDQESAPLVPFGEFSTRSRYHCVDGTTRRVHLAITVYRLTVCIEEVGENKGLCLLFHNKCFM